MATIEQVIVEDRLTFTFPTLALATKYDDWSHYRNQFNKSFGGTKAVDIIFVDQDTTWLIEIKDYRQNPRLKPIELHEEVASKVKDTLAGLVSAALNANDAGEKQFGRAAIKKNRIRIVLHLELPSTISKLFPQALNRANVLTKLRQSVRSVDPHPAVVDKSTLHPTMNWTVLST